VSPGSRKCVKEEVHKDVLITGDFWIQASENHKVDIRVFDSKEAVLYNRVGQYKMHPSDKNPEASMENDEGKFAFTTDANEVVNICFHSKASGWAREPKFHEVSVKIRKGTEARNYDEAGKTEKLKPLEIELRRLEDLSDSIVNDFQFMKQREEEMRSTNLSTNSRVLYFSAFSMMCLIGLATWQVLYLKKFFKSKKLIE